METVATATGWKVRRAAASPGIVANRTDIAVNGETVPQVRGFFEGLATRVPGGETTTAGKLAFSVVGAGSPPAHRAMLAH